MGNEGRLVASYTLFSLKNLKIQGPRLDKEYKQEMDKVQVELVRLCQMQQVDLAVRLQMLELIELRSLGWKANQEIEEYYKNHFDTIARGKIPTSSFDEEMASLDSVRLDGDGARSNSSGQPSSSVNVYEEELLIGAYKLTLKCPENSSTTLETTVGKFVQVQE